MGERLIQILAALAFGAILLALCACDGEYERQLRIAERNQRFANGCTPGIGERLEIEWRYGQLVCYPYGKKRQAFVVTELNQGYE